MISIRNRHFGTLAVVLFLWACASPSEGTGADDTDTTKASLPVPTDPPSSAVAVQEIEELDSFAPFRPGTYSIDPDIDASSQLRVVYLIPAEGWQRWNGAVKFADDGGHVAITITTITNVVRDGCDDHSWRNPPVGPSVDSLATALADLAPFRLISRPEQVSIYGYPGAYLELTVPDLPMQDGDAPFKGCVGGYLRSWVAPFDTEPGDGFYGYTGPGYVEEFWILDVDGTRLMIAAGRSANSSAEDIAEMREILDSIRIEP